MHLGNISYLSWILRGCSIFSNEDMPWAVWVTRLNRQYLFSNYVPDRLCQLCMCYLVQFLQWHKLLLHVWVNSLGQRKTMIKQFTPRLQKWMNSEFDTRQPDFRVCTFSCWVPLLFYIDDLLFQRYFFEIIFGLDYELIEIGVISSPTA